MAANKDKKPTVLAIAVEAVQRGDADGLLAVLRSPEGEALPRGCGVQPGRIAARQGDVDCLRVLGDCGFDFDTSVWVLAAYYGHANCLAFALTHGYVRRDYVLYDLVLYAAVEHGQVAVVDLVLQQGLPRKPFLLEHYYVRPHTMKCVELLLARGVVFDPESLIDAAKCGDLDLVRTLHAHGVPLWRHARELQLYPPHPHYWRWYGYLRLLRLDIPVLGSWETPADMPMTLVVPASLDDGRYTCTTIDIGYGYQRTRQYVSCDYVGRGAWKTLRYGSLHGAPVTRRVRRFFEEKRQRTHAVLLCFAAAARLSRGPGGPEDRRVWAGMATVPSPIVEEVLIRGDFEIRESVVGVEAPASALAL